jgi:hypothetical protein
MERSRRIARGVIGAGLLVAACAYLRVSLDEQRAPSAIVEPIAGTTLSRVTLKAKAAKRIDALRNKLNVGTA